MRPDDATLRALLGGAAEPAPGTEPGEGPA
jgi:hypothetical protein